MVGKKRASNAEERALRGLVFAYLAQEYPRVAQLMEAQAVVHDFEAGIDEERDNADGTSVAAEKAIAQVFGKGAQLRDIVHRRAAGKKGLKPTPKPTPRHPPAKAAAAADSDDEDVATKPLAVKPAGRVVSPTHAPAAARRPIPQDSDDDEADRKKPATAKPASRKASPKHAPAATSKKPIVEDSDDEEAAPKAAAKPASRKASPKHAPAAATKPVADDSDDEAAPKAAKPASRKASPKLAPARKPVVNDSSDDDEAPKAPARRVSPKQAAKPALKPAADDDSDDEAAPKPARRASPKSAPANPRQGDDAPRAGKKQPGERFCRIDVTAVQFTNDRLRDNRCRDDTASFLQNKKMLAVRGKEFNKHKQKNKAKLYAAGVDQGVHSYKFDEESD